ncbi:MAG TPA: rod-binding protein [Pseudothermotoga sp.]|nr:rod-binding protein [Pseudothermotoga sp.]
MMISSISNTVQKDQLWNACSEFVGSLFYDIFKKMYESIPQSDLIPKSSAEKWYTNMLLYEYSKQAAKDDLKPLVDMIYKKLATKTYQ